MADKIKTGTVVANPYIAKFILLYHSCVGRRQTAVKMGNILKL